MSSSRPQRVTFTGGGTQPREAPRLHTPPCSALFLQVDDPARRVERWVLGGGVQGGVTGEAAGRGPVCQQTLLPKKRLCQVSVVAPIQLRRKVVGVPSKQLIPAPAQQNLVLRARPEKTSVLVTQRPSPSPETSLDCEPGGSAPQLRQTPRSDPSEAGGQWASLRCLLGNEAITLEAIFKNQIVPILRGNYL